MRIMVKINAEIYPTESDEKVLTALRNIINSHRDMTYRTVIKNEKKEIIIEGGLHLLDNLKRKISLKQIQPLIRIILFKNKRNSSSYILFNKQAAYVNRIVVCESPHESPLGPIKVEIIGEEEEDLDLAIYWLTEDTELSELKL